MSFLGNPASGSGRQFKAARSTFSNTATRATNLIGQGVRNAKDTLSDTKGDVQGTIKNRMEALAQQGLPGVTLSGTGGGLGGSIDSQGNVLFNRSGESQGWMDTLGGGLSQDEAAYAGLLGQIAPGYGLLSQSAEQTLQNAKAKAVGDLQANLAKRRVLGSSFANDQLASVSNQYDQDIQAAKAQALVQELQLTQGVIQDRTNARLATANQALTQINYETGVKATLLANTQNNLMQLQSAQTDLAKTLATLQAGLGTTRAGIEAQGGIAQGDVTANLGSANAQTYPQQAQLNAEGKQAQNNSIGSLIGAGLGMFSFGTGGTPAA